MANEKVTVIVPVYNVEKYLRQCLDSIVNQSYRNLEIILVDDGSPDNCGAICDEYAAKDSRIRVIHQENGGLSAARNAGLDIATGEYIAFVDSDDWVSDVFIETMVSAAEPNSVVMCNFIYWKSENNCSVALDEATVETIGTATFWNRTLGAGCVPYTVVWNKLYPRHIFAKCRFFEGLIHEDEEILHHIIDQICQIKTISEPMYFYRRTRTSITGCGFNPRRLDLFVGLALRLQYFRRKKMKGQADDLAVRYWRNFRDWFPAVKKSEDTKFLLRRAIQYYKLAFPSLMYTPKIRFTQKISIIAMRISPEFFRIMWCTINFVRGNR